MVRGFLSAAYRSLFPRFTSLERSLIQTLLDALSEDAARILRSQVDDVGAVRRWSKGRQVVYYPTPKDEDRRNESLRFPSGEEELKFAHLVYGPTDR